MGELSLKFRAYSPFISPDPAADRIVARITLNLGVYDVSGAENAKKSKRPVVETKIVDTESGDGGLFAAVRSLNAFHTVLSYASHFHVTLPCSSSGKERPRP